MNRCLLLIAMALGTAACLGDGPAPPDAAAKAQPAFVVIFDFDAPDLGELGTQLARSVQDKIRRLKVEGLTLIDPLTAAEATARYKVGFDAAPARVSSVLAGELAANVAVLGRLTQQGQDYTASVRLLDLRGGGDDWTWTRQFKADGERARGLLADRIAEAVTGAKVAKPLEVGYDPEPATLGPAVTANGGFEQADAKRPDLPAAWSGIDGLTALWAEDSEGRRGKVLRINTDVYEWQWKKWQERIAAGAKPADAPKPVATRGPKYDTVAGTYGIHVYSDAIDARPGMRYRVLADMTGKTTDFFFPKVFVKGYRQVKEGDESAAQDREVWRTYLACRNFEGTWQHFSQTLTPAREVERLRVIVYAYWPPGVYEFDNVRLVEEPPAATQPDVPDSP
ncbi:MAG: hypothetical protein BIFFINMI_01904 [Phycisphaerae bacterium]|nr:hypothetical protein [Phycisphaerae bacterium]